MGHDERPLRLLSLDGGGIRGFSELIILEAIMKQARRIAGLDEVPLPADYFDLIAGTSAGGLIAIMLGRLRMTIEEAKAAYGKLSADMFQKQQSFKLFEEGRLDDRAFNQIVRGIIKDRLGDADAKLKASEDDSCRIFVCTVCKGNVPQIRLFKSYPSADSLEHDCMVWEAARATSAAPTYYAPIEIGSPGREESFIDGGIGCNNPIYELHSEAERLFDQSRRVACVLSLGTGKRNVNQLPELHLAEKLLAPNKFKGVRDLAKSFKRMVIDSDSRAADMDLKYRDLDGVYFRFTVEQGLQGVKLAEPQKLADVTTQTISYLSQPTIAAEIRRAALALVGGTESAHEYRLGHLSLSNKTVIETSRQMYDSQRSAQEKRTLFRNLFSQINASVDPVRDYHDNLSRRFVHPETGAATCSWIQERDEYKSTIDSSKPSVLWVKGRAGTGKSVLASTIIESLSATASGTKSTVPLYYFCHHTSPQTTLKQIVCSFLVQISHWGDDWVVDLMESFIQTWPNLSSPDDRLDAALLSLLKDIIAKKDEKVFVVVDSVESCHVGARPPIPSLIDSICRTSASAGATLIFTSRLSFDLSKTQPSQNEDTDRELQFHQVELTTEDTAADLAAVLDYKISGQGSTLSSKPDKQREEIIATIKDRADGMFLYATLVLDELRGDRIASNRAIQRTLETLPEGIFRMYDRQLELVKSKWKAPEVFWWIYAASRHLSWEELRNGIAIVDGAYDEEELIDQNSEDFLLETCGLLVELSGPDKSHVRFIHPTIRELLDQEQSPRSTLDMHLAHPMVATKLLTILCLEDVPDLGEEKIDGATILLQYGNKQGRKLYQYAVLNWYRHLKACGSFANQDLETALLRFLTSAASLKWLVAALVTLNSGQVEQADIYAFAEDIADCLWSFMQSAEASIQAALGEEIESWVMSFLTLMLDWRNLLEQRPQQVYAIHFDLLPEDNRFRQLAEARSYQSVVRFSKDALQTRSSLRPVWQDHVFVVDERRNFAYAFQGGYLQCYHSKTKLLVAEVYIGRATCNDIVLSPDKSFLALLCTHSLELDEHSASHITNLRQGLQLSTLVESSYIAAWRLETEEDKNETRALSGLLLVPKLKREVFFFQLRYDGLSRTNLFGPPPDKSSNSLKTFEADVVWRLDDLTHIQFAPDSGMIATPVGLISNPAAASVPIPKSFLPEKRDCRSTKVSKDLTTVATLRDRNILELWSLETDAVRHSTKIDGIGHILAVSLSARYVLLLRVQNCPEMEKSRGLGNGQPQLGTVSIYDAVSGVWHDLLLLRPPRSKKLDSWAFQLSPFDPHFTGEEAIPKVTFLVPPGWSLAVNVRSASGIRAGSALADGQHIVVFEGNANRDAGGFGSEPILRQMIPIPSSPRALKDSFIFPKILSWDERLDSCLACSEGSISRIETKDLQSWAMRRQRSLYDNTNHEAFRITLASAVIVTPDRQALYRVRLVLRGTEGDDQSEEQPSAEQPHTRKITGTFDLAFQSVAHHDAFPGECFVRDLDLSGKYFPPLSESYFSVFGNTALVGPLEYRFEFSNGHLQANAVEESQSLFRRTTAAFTAACRPFRRKTSRLFQVFANQVSRSSLTIFSESDVSLSGPAAKKGDDSGNNFIASVTRTHQSLSIGQFTKLVDSGDVEFGIQREAQTFEVYLTIFDNDGSLRWMMNTTTAGPIIKGDAISPNVAWAVHPTEPLLAWALPGHRIRLSHIGSSRHPLNIAEPLEIQSDSCEALQFSPSGSYLLVQGKEAACNAFFNPSGKSDKRTFSVFDFKGGFQARLTLTATSVLSVEITDENIRIYSVTRNDAIEMIACDLPYMNALERYHITYIPSDCCCPTCGRPFQQMCRVSIQNLGNSINVILGHEPARVGSSRLGVGSACEPLILRVVVPKVSLGSISTDDPAIQRKVAAAHLILDKNGTLDLPAFDRYSDSRKGGSWEAALSGLIDDDGARHSSNLARLLFAIIGSAFMVDVKSEEDPAGAFDIIQKAGEILRQTLIRQPILKVRDSLTSDAESTPIPPGEVEDLVNKLEIEATEKLVFGDTIEETCDEVLAALKKSLGEELLPYDSWSDFTEAINEITSDEEFYDMMGEFMDQVTGAGEGGIGCKLPLMIYTFYFPFDLGQHQGTEGQPSRQGRDATAETYNWTLALDVGWIEEDIARLQRRMFLDGMASARSWYDFPNLRDAAGVGGALGDSSTPAFDAEAASAKLGDFVSRIFGNAKARTNTEDEQAEDGPTATNGARTHSEGATADDAAAPKTENGGKQPSNGRRRLEVSHLVELQEAWQDMAKTMSDTLPGAGDFVSLRLKALMHQSFVRDLED